jgi:hypothetical protein
VWLTVLQVCGHVVHRHCLREALAWRVVAGFTILNYIDGLSRATTKPCPHEGSPYKWIISPTSRIWPIWFFSYARPCITFAHMQCDQALTVYLTILYGSTIVDSSTLYGSTTFDYILRINYIRLHCGSTSTTPHSTILYGSTTLYPWHISHSLRDSFYVLDGSQ